MAYGDGEISVQDGAPVELYEIAYTGNFWYYTSADHDIIRDGRTYLAVPASHDNIIPSVDVEKTGLNILFPGDAAFGDVFRVQPPSEVVTLTILVDNYLAPGELVVVWKGKLINVNWNADGMLEVVCENVYSSLQRPGLRRRYSTTCPYALYGTQCGVNREDFRENTPALGINGLVVNAAAAAGKVDNWYAGGYATWENNLNGNQEKRMIRQSTADGNLSLASPPVGLAPGQTMAIYAGCDHLINTCATKFNNEERNGSTPYIPGLNPFGGATIY